MHPVLRKTFGGLSREYYFRQFVFGLIFPAMLYATSRNTKSGLPVVMAVLMVVNTLLYPYARFVYESVVDFFMGRNVFFVNSILMLITKIFTMALCWTFAMFISPIGLLYLYFHHSRQPRYEAASDLK
jgi:hypothetical protein